MNAKNLAKAISKATTVEEVHSLIAEGESRKTVLGARDARLKQLAELALSTNTTTESIGSETGKESDSETEETKEASKEVDSTKESDSETEKETGVETKISAEKIQDFKNKLPYACRAQVVHDFAKAFFKRDFKKFEHEKGSVKCTVTLVDGQTIDHRCV